ncbi:MAG TPA: hypothetical protein VGC41_09845 [Kofleriaceae bacterium]
MRIAPLLALTGCVTGLHVTQSAQATDRATPFSLASQTEDRVALTAEPTVLVFYRGFW